LILVGFVVDASVSHMFFRLTICSETTNFR
jgi:hypothetical protein